MFSSPTPQTDYSRKSFLLMARAFLHLPCGRSTQRSRGFPQPSAQRRLTVTAEVLIAEIGVDMSRFPSEHDLASWAGLCPGNNESAGKHKAGTTRRV